jgi:DNA-binding beta-propeller fold protein YncE
VVSRLLTTTMNTTDLQGMRTPVYTVDPTWPSELPEGWVLGQVGCVCVDASDNVLVLNRRDITDEESENGTNAPPVIVFDADGEVIHTWGDPELMPTKLHGAYVDHEHCVWITGMHDGIVQKYDWEGRLLLQVGVKGVFDTTDGTMSGAALNAGTDTFFKPTGVAVDPESGEVFVSDGYGNRRVVALDRTGRFLRQWGRQAEPAEAAAGEPGVFAKVVHGIALSNDRQLYVCDRQGNRVQVFERSGEFVRNIWVTRGGDETPGHRGTAWWVAFSPDAEQRYLFVMDGGNERVRVLDRRSGEMLTSFGRPGHQAGAFTHGHTLAVDSGGSIYVAETNTGRRIQKFRISPVGEHPEAN